MNAPTVSMLVLAATAGLAAGFLLAWLFLRGKQSRQASEREALKQELDDYRSRVDQHFADTAEAVDALNRSYQNVIRHLSNGAQTLMGKEALQEQLAKRGDKAVTLGYLAGSVLPAAESDGQQSAAEQIQAETVEPASQTGLQTEAAEEAVRPSENAASEAEAEDKAETEMAEAADAETPEQEQAKPEDK